MDIIFKYNNSADVIVNLSDKIKELEKWTLPDDTSFYEVIIPEGIEKIRYSTFEDCKCLQKVMFPENLLEVGSSAFRNCSSLESVEFKSGLKGIGSEAFEGCGSLESVVLPDSLKEIGSEAFLKCSNLKNINVPEYALKESRYSFLKGCKKLADENGYIIYGNQLHGYVGCEDEIIIPESVNEILSYAFGGFFESSKIKKVTIRGNVKIICKFAFFRCTELEEVKIEEGVKFIAESTFEGCDNLVSLIIPDSTSVDKMFGDYLGRFPEGLKTYALELSKHLSDAEILNFKLWECLPEPQKTRLFFGRNQKKFVAEYQKFVKKNGAEICGNWILELINRELLAKECTFIANFLIAYNADISDSMVQTMYDILRNQKNGKKAVIALNDIDEILNRVNYEPVSAIIADSKPSTKSKKKAKTLSPREELREQFCEAHGFTSKDLKKSLKSNYNISITEIEPLRYENGKVVPAYWIEYLLSYNGASTRLYETELGKVNLHDELLQFTEEIKSCHLQWFIKDLADRHLGQKGKKKQHNLSYIICRLADEKTMLELSKRAHGWTSTSNGIDAPALREFRKAAVCSNTRAAMLFAEHYGELEEYAKARNFDTEFLADKIMSDLEPDADGNKAAEDQDTLRKLTKLVAKYRAKVIKRAFLSGKKWDADYWKELMETNPLIRNSGKNIVWIQGSKSFTISQDSYVDNDGMAYELTDEEIMVAHPIEMEDAEICKWKDFFAERNLSQPFEQIGERKYKLEEIQVNRYADKKVAAKRFDNLDEDGIHRVSLYSSETFSMDEVEFEREASWLGFNDELFYSISEFHITDITRKTNHIISVLDQLVGMK